MSGGGRKKIAGRRKKRAKPLTSEVQKRYLCAVPLETDKNTAATPNNPPPSAVIATWTRLNFASLSS